MKPIKLGESRTYTVEGTEVVLTRVEPTYYSFGYSTGNGERREHRSAEQKSRYEITVDGVLRGHVQIASGFGNPWHISALGTIRSYAQDWERDRPVSVYSSSIKRADPREDRDGMVLHVPRLIREGLLPTLEEIAKGKVEYAEQMARRKAEEDANRARWAKEREEREIVEAAKRKEVFDTLIGIRDRLQGQMSNFEVDMLSSVAEHWKAK